VDEISEGITKSSNSLTETQREVNE
jgi:hypothetical protein